MPCVVLTEGEIAALQALLAGQDERYACVQLALSHPFVDLTDFSGDIQELIRLARGASRHVSEDFESLIEALATLAIQEKTIAAARKGMPSE